MKQVRQTGSRSPRHTPWRAGAALVLAALAVTAAAPAHAASAGSGTVPAAGAVVGFGDSVAAGFRAVDTISTSPYAANCARTDAGYPTLVGAALELPTVNLACAGATTPAGVLGPQTTPIGEVPAQLEQAAALPHISLATLTVGANDVTWSTWLAQCASPAADCATEANTTAFRRQLFKANAGVVKALYRLTWSLGADHVSLTGYYDPLGSLAPAFGFTPDEVLWYKARLNDVNTVLQADARAFPHVSYVSLLSLDAAAGDIQLNPAADGIFHPTVQGQEKIKAAVLADYAALPAR